MKATSIAHSYAHDHDRLDGLFQQYRQLKGVDLPNARTVFGEFRARLERHIVWEEEILFPAFEDKTGLRDGGPTTVMRLEHRQIKQYLANIAATLQRGDAATDQLDQDLLEVLGAHNQKEEGILYPAIDEMLDEHERAAVFERMTARVDVRPLPPARRHATAFGTFHALPPGAAFVLVNDHDPKPLYDQFAAEHAGQFTWDYLEQGPEVWRVRIGKA